MKFKNKNNGYIEETSSLTFLWVLLFGVFYFLYKRIWSHALISFGLAVISSGVSWFIYPFFGREIVRKNFLRSGWVEISDTGEELDSNIEVGKSKTGDRVFILIMTILVVSIVAQLIMMKG